MSDLLARLARYLTHHWKRSLLGTIIVIVLLGIAAGAGGKAADDFKIPGTESQQAIDVLKAHSPALAGSDAQIVFRSKGGAISDPENRKAIEGAVAKIAALPDGAKDRHPVALNPFTNKGSISADGTVAVVDVRYSMDPSKLEAEDGKALEEAARTAETDSNVAVAMRGTVIDIAAEQSVPVGELIGVGVAIILLTILFRSGAAMLATLIGALLGVMIGQILLTALAKPLGLPEFATTIAMMLGLGAGIDYSLLIIGRFREQMAAGDSVRDAAAKAAATAGSSVVAAGLIVMVAIAGLLVIGIPMIGKMGIGAAIGVAAVVVSALTVLPIMIGAFQKRLRPKKASHVAASPAFARWAERITARPWLSIGLGVLILLVFAFPVTQMRLGQPDDGNQPVDRTQRIAYDTLSSAFGPGTNGAFIITIDTPQKDTAVLAPIGKAINDLQAAQATGSAAGATAAAKAAAQKQAAKAQAELQRAQTAAEKAAPETLQAMARLSQGVKDAKGMVPSSVAGAIPTPDGGAAILFATPKTAPQDEQTSKTLSLLRKQVIPEATKGSPLQGKVYVGGNTAGFEDFSAKVSDRLIPFIAIVIALSVLLLMMAFRSLWIPLISAVFNLLSVGAAYGAIVAVFQDGVGASLIGVDSGVPIVSFIPVMVFAILFGLSMDYNVFLLSRIHEAHKEGDGPRESVINGVSRIGKVVLFAGLVMASVFLAFVSTDDVISKMFGVGLGLAILIDVLIVRLLIAPAVVVLLGDKAWWLPAWMDRLLPNVSLEGHLVQNVDPQGEPLAGIDPQTGQAAPAA